MLVSMSMLAALATALSSASPSAATRGGTLTPAALTALERGQIVEIRDWLPADLVSALREDARGLQSSGAFVSSGLSNTAKGGRKGQGFDSSDRAVCAVTPTLGGDVAARQAFSQRLTKVQEALAARGRPGLVCAEQYYSCSGAGAGLARHMDERHDELKGARGWSSPFRRSVSWLAYLCEDGWGDAGSKAGAGGELRAYVRDGVATGTPVARCGAHEGNLQVGWRSARDGQSEPVFLDAWVRAEMAGYAELAPEEQAMIPRWLSLAALYRVVPDAQGTGGGAAAREYLTRGVEGGGAHTIDDLIATMTVGERARFSPVDTTAAAVAPEGSSEVLVQPLGGSLLLFDSVAVPHEVQQTLRGRRWAMAGWFHEPAQQIPAWLLGESA